MEKITIEELESLHLDLASDVNNWKLAEKYRLTITEIRFLDANSNAVTVYLHERKQGLRLWREVA